MSELGVLDSIYSDLVISEDGQTIYGLIETASVFQDVHVINYKNKTIEQVIALEKQAIRLFLDDDTLIIVDAWLTFSESGDIRIPTITKISL